MRKIIVLISALVLSSSAAWAADSYLYWMVGPVAENLAFDVAQIWYMDSSGNKIAALTERESGMIDISSDPESDYRATSAVYSLLPENYQDYKYIVELFADDLIIGTTAEPVGYADLEKYIYTATKQTDEYFPFTASVPEPSGALLALLGFGLMALRRKREKV